MILITISSDEYTGQTHTKSFNTQFITTPWYYVNKSTQKHYVGKHDIGDVTMCSERWWVIDTFICVLQLVSDYYLTPTEIFFQLYESENKFH